MLTSARLMFNSIVAERFAGANGQQNVMMITVIKTMAVILDNRIQVQE